MIFEIQATRFEDGDTQTFFYDNMANVLKDSEGNLFEYPQDQMPQHRNLLIRIGHSRNLN